jgi:mRNA-degrading endonuclease toxin of MazEF toxin-antitoxin module
MSRYKRDDVVRVPFAYFSKQKGCFEEKARPFVVIDVEDETGNITVSCTTQLHQSNKYSGITVKADSEEGRQMGINEDSFIYCNQTITLKNSEIKRRIGTCPFIKDILKLLNYPDEGD